MKAQSCAKPGRMKLQNSALEYSVYHPNFGVDKGFFFLPSYVRSGEKKKSTSNQGSNVP